MRAYGMPDLLIGAKRQQTGRHSQDVLRVSCSKCERDGCYGLSRLINQRGRDAKLIDGSTN